MGNKRGEILEELIAKTLRNIILANPIFIQSPLEYDSDNIFVNPRSIPDLQTIQALLVNGGTVIQQSTHTDLDSDGNLDISGLVVNGNSSFVTRIDYDYTAVSIGDNPFYPSLTGYYNLYAQDVNGLLYISSTPPASGTWNITVFATDLSITPPPPPVNPVITLQPNSTATIYEGRTLTQIVAATGAIGYQWRKGGVDIPGQTTDTLTISDFDVTDNGSYTCYIYSGSGSVTSTACVAAMFVPVAGQLVLINNSGTTVDWEHGPSGTTGTVANGGIFDYNPLINGTYFMTYLPQNKILTTKRYSNIGVLESTQMDDNLFFPDITVYVFPIPSSAKGYTLVVSF